jgi:hypothetical protein
MTHKTDDTLKDLNRRDIAFPKYYVEEVLPEFFKTEYPKLISLLTEYYHFEEDDESPSRLVNDLFNNRDITQTDIDLLSYIEDELLLGQSYFEGFADKRAAAKYSSTLYRSKGTKYSIQQFFRTFFSIDPDVIYTKENVFKVGEADSQIGFNSQKFITDNRLYQTFAILVKSELAFNEWKEPYKLFTHPAGMFIGSEVQIVSDVTDTLTAPKVIPADPPPITVENNASFGSLATLDITALVDDLYSDSDGVLSRINPELADIRGLSIGDIQTIENQYSSLREAQIASSPTFDDDEPIDATSVVVNSGIAANTFTKLGDAQLTSNLAKFGGGSLILDGDTDGLLSDNSVDIYDSAKSGTDKNVFTVEMWINTPDVTQIAYLYDNWVTGTTRQPIYLNTNNFVVSVNNGIAGTHSAGLSNNTWHHIAYVKDGSAYYVYTDGVLKGSGVANAGSVDYSGTYMIGRQKDQVNLEFNGYIDEFRLSNSALYTGASFTPQTAEYTNDSSTIDLLHFGAEPNGRGMDLSNDFRFETIDQEKHIWYSDDSDQYIKSFTL